MKDTNKLTYPETCNEWGEPWEKVEERNEKEIARIKHVSEFKIPKRNCFFPDEEFLE